MHSRPGRLATALVATSLLAATPVVPPTEDRGIAPDAPVRLVDALDDPAVTAALRDLPAGLLPGFGEDAGTTTAGHGGGLYPRFDRRRAVTDVGDVDLDGDADVLVLEAEGDGDGDGRLVVARDGRSGEPLWSRAGSFDGDFGYLDAFLLDGDVDGDGWADTWERSGGVEPLPDADHVTFTVRSGPTGEVLFSVREAVLREEQTTTDDGDTTTTRYAHRLPLLLDEQVGGPGTVTLLILDSEEVVTTTRTGDAVGTRTRTSEVRSTLEVRHLDATGAQVGGGVLDLGRARPAILARDDVDGDGRQDLLLGTAGRTNGTETCTTTPVGNVCDGSLPAYGYEVIAVSLTDATATWRRVGAPVRAAMVLPPTDDRGGRDVVLWDSFDLVPGPMLLDGRDGSVRWIGGQGGAQLGDVRGAGELPDGRRALLLVDLEQGEDETTGDPYLRLVVRRVDQRDGRLVFETSHELPPDTLYLSDFSAYRGDLDGDGMDDVVFDAVLDRDTSVRVLGLRPLGLTLTRSAARVVESGATGDAFDGLQLPPQGVDEGDRRVALSFTAPDLDGDGSDDLWAIVVPDRSGEDVTIDAYAGRSGALLWRVDHMTAASDTLTPVEHWTDLDGDGAADVTLEEACGPVEDDVLTFDRLSVRRGADLAEVWAEECRG